MRRRNAAEILIKNPARGLLTRIPSDMSAETLGQFIVKAKNIRADNGALRNAPGYERVVTLPENIDSPASLIFEANIEASNRESKRAAIVATDGKIYTVLRRARPLVCDVPCSVRFAAVGDTGYNNSAASNVAKLIRSWSPNWMQHFGDMIYRTGDSGYDDSEDFYEYLLFKYYYPFVGGYRGPWGVGPDKNNFFPAFGNHDWDDVPIQRAYEAFPMVSAAFRSYTYRRGPVQVWVVSTYGPQTGAGVGVGESDVSVTGPIATWLQASMLASDAPWKIVVNPFPPFSSASGKGGGDASQDWPYASWGANLVLGGDSHTYERIFLNGINYIICGTGGAALGTFTTPVAGSQVRISGFYGALRITADMFQLTCEYITVDDVVRDSVSLTAPQEGSVCYVGDLAKQPTSLIIQPDCPSVEVGQTWQYKAYLLYIDGTADDITDVAKWSMDVPSIASVGTTGLATGLSSGTANVTATYSGLSDTTCLNVAHSCQEGPAEWIMVFDVSNSMNASSGFGTRLEKLKAAAKQFVDSVNQEQDKIGIVATNGYFSTQVESARLVQPLTDNMSAVKGAIDSLTAAHDTCLGDGVDVARYEFIGSNHNPSVNQRRLILFVDQPSEVTNPGGTSSSLTAARTAAMAATTTAINTIKDLGVCVSVIALDIRDSAYRTTIESWATKGYFNHVWTADELEAVFAFIANKYCGFGCNAYYSENPICPLGTPRLNYDNFANWIVPGNVIEGYWVDLCGVGTGGQALYDIWPGSQLLYVDLAGSAPRGGIGRIITRHPIAWGNATKRYRLSMKLAGNGRQLVEATTSIHVGWNSPVNGLTETVFSVWKLFQVTLPWNQPFTEYVWEFEGSPIAGTSLATDLVGAIQIGMEPGPKERWDAIGNFVDDVKLEDITNPSSPVVMLWDNFNSETC
jgi:hypothetical protein